LVLTPDETAPAVVENIRRIGLKDRIEVIWKRWDQVHAWVCGRAREDGRGQAGLRDFFLRRLRGYLEMSEVGGFAGFVFDGEYEIRRARALLKVFRVPLQGKVQEDYPALIFGKKLLTADGDVVWDVFAASQNFTLAPHLTVCIHPDGPDISLTVPDKSKGAWKSLARITREQDELERTLRETLRAILSVPRPRRPTVWMALLQRHWENMNTKVTDAEIVVRLDVTSLCPAALQGRGTKREDSWLEALVRLLAGGKGRANWEFQLRVKFDMAQKIVGQPALVDEFARIAKALKPIYSLMM
jgi:hypothetical protein